MFSQLDEESVIGFLYPAANYQGVRNRRFEPRRVWIERVRHIDRDPLASITLEAEPLLCRGKTLVTGIDLDKLARRSFYLESMSDVQVLPARECESHRVYILDPSGELPPFLAYSTDCIGQAWRWIRGWERDHQGHAAVLWPVGARPPVAIRPLEPLVA